MEKGQERGGREETVDDIGPVDVLPAGLVLAEELRCKILGALITLLDVALTLADASGVHRNKFPIR